MWYNLIVYCLQKPSRSCRHLALDCQQKWCTSCFETILHQIVDRNPADSETICRQSISNYQFLSTISCLVRFAQFLSTICLHIMSTGDEQDRSLMRTQLMTDCRYFLLESADSLLEDCRHFAIWRHMDILFISLSTMIPYFCSSLILVQRKLYDNCSKLRKNSVKFDIKFYRQFGDTCLGIYHSVNMHQF